jgi:F-type H+-transporting ATPase subunit epsilon
MSSLELEILVPDGVVVHCRIAALRGNDATGSFGIWPGHEAFVTVLEPGLLMYRLEDGTERFAAVDGGVLLLENNQVSITSRDVAAAERLEQVADAAAAMLAARRQKEHLAAGEFAELQTTLFREMKKLEQKR